MSKVNLSPLVGGYLDVAKINDNFSKIQAALDNTLSRDGTAPNYMEGPIDLNGQTLLNSGADPTDPDAVVTRSVIETLVAEKASGFVVQRVQEFTATAAQTIFTLTDFNYQPGANNLAVYLNGVRTFAFTETNATQFVLASGVSSGTKVAAVVNDFLGTVSLPPHTHSWSQVIGAPVYTTRWPTWSEVTSKPTSFPPDPSATYSATQITAGRLADARRGVYVQASAPSLGAGDAGCLWFW
jgi:hypothetical protein